MLHFSANRISQIKAHARALAQRRKKVQVSPSRRGEKVFKFPDLGLRDPVRPRATARKPATTIDAFLKDWGRRGGFSLR